MPQAMMKLWEKPISHNLPSHTEILCNLPLGPHTPGQQDPAPIDLESLEVT